MTYFLKTVFFIAIQIWLFIGLPKLENMKTILFPFNIEQDNKAAYAKTMDMAQQMQAKVIFFTCLPDLSPTLKDKAYFHLLGLNGDYQTNHNNWQSIPNVKTERVFTTGNFDLNLKELLERTLVDWIVPTTVIKKYFSATYAQSPSLKMIKTTQPYYPNLSVENSRF